MIRIGPPLMYKPRPRPLTDWVFVPQTNDNIIAIMTIQTNIMMMEKDEDDPGEYFRKVAAARLSLAVLYRDDLITYRDEAIRNHLALLAMEDKVPELATEFEESRKELRILYHVPVNHLQSADV